VRRLFVNLRSICFLEYCKVASGYAVVVLVVVFVVWVVLGVGIV